MLSDEELEQHMSALQIPTAGRALVRKIRRDGPERELQGRMDCVRVRHISRKMGGRALYAESRTVEFPGIYFREFDPQTLEIWPQPCKFDLHVQGPKGATRLQHTPDLFLVREDGLLIEEWRTETRLARLAHERPEHFYKDQDGKWHYAPFEEHIKSLGIEYRLRSADEHPVHFLSNLVILEDFTLESTPPIPVDELKRLKLLLREHKRVEHVQLVKEYGFKAEHVFQAVLQRDVFVDLHQTALRDFANLVIYEDEHVARADELLHASEVNERGGLYSSLTVAPGARFTYDSVPYEILIVGGTEIVVKNMQGQASQLPTQLVQELFSKEQIKQLQGANLPPPIGAVTDGVVLNVRGLPKAVQKLSALTSTESSHGLSTRTVQRAKATVAGMSCVQDQLMALAPSSGGNYKSKLPTEVIDQALKVLKEVYNKPEAPTVDAAYRHHVKGCTDLELKPMSRWGFYKLAKREKSVRAREGKRQAYQQEPVPFYLDYGHPVHGVLPHEVCYCDHTIMNAMLRGMDDQNLGKPTLTLMMDGALSKPRAFFLSFQPASVYTVMMCLRDYARRHGRLPRVLVLDNGKEFHSEALQLFCKLFNIQIRWRRRSKPRDSTIVERAIGATETEVIAQLKGNSIALKDPRLVSSTHNPEKHIEWTLPALHGALNHYLFEIHPQRVHPRFGITPNEKEEQLTLLGGARGHLMVRYDQVFKLLTAPYAEQPTRKLDPLRGIYVDGTYHWTNEFKGIPDGTALAVRVEPWNAEVIYVEVNKRWVVARARMAPHLTGRHRYELELQIREERRRRKALATADKSRPEIASQSVRLWSPNEWDPRLREQQVEAYVLYAALGMTEVMSEGVNEFATRLQAELPQGSQSRLLFEDDPPEASVVQPTFLPGPDIPTTNAATSERESAPPSPRRMESEPTEYDYF